MSKQFGMDVPIPPNYSIGYAVASVTAPAELTPWPYGPTHPSNNKCYCRIHHLAKTFLPGWVEQQLPDGTLLLTSPTGHLYRSEPHGASLFPALGQPTGELDLPPYQPDPEADRWALVKYIRSLHK